MISLSLSLMLDVVQRRRAERSWTSVLNRVQLHWVQYKNEKRKNKSQIPRINRPSCLSLSWSVFTTELILVALKNVFFLLIEMAILCAKHSRREWAICACMLTGLRARKSINESLLTAMYCSKSNIITLFSFEFPFSCTYSLVELRSCENVPYFSHRIVACTYTSNTPSLSTPALFYSDIMAIALNTINISKNFA